MTLVFQSKINGGLLKVKYGAFLYVFAWFLDRDHPIADIYNMYMSPLIILKSDLQPLSLMLLVSIFSIFYDIAVCNSFIVGQRGSECQTQLLTIQGLGVLWKGQI